MTYSAVTHRHWRPAVIADMAVPCVQDAVDEQMGPLLRDNKPRWLGDVKMTRFTMGSKARRSIMLRRDVAGVHRWSGQG